MWNQINFGVCGLLQIEKLQAVINQIVDTEKEQNLWGIWGKGQSKIVD